LASPANNIVSEKITSGTLSETETTGVVLVSVEREMEEKIASAIQIAVTGGKSGGRNANQLSAGALFADPGTVPPEAHVLLPVSYAISVEGLFFFQTDNTDITLKRLSKTPFFVSAREDSGRVLMVRRINSVWLRDFIRPSSISGKLLLDLLIFPEPGVKSRELVEYALACASIAPFTRTNDIESVIYLLIDEFLPQGTVYPAVVAVPQLRKRCSDLEVRYTDVRKWLAQRGYIDERSLVDRDETKKPTRFLVFPREVKISG